MCIKCQHGGMDFALHEAREGGGSKAQFYIWTVCLHSPLHSAAQWHSLEGDVDADWAKLEYPLQRHHTMVYGMRANSPGGEEATEGHGRASKERT